MRLLVGLWIYLLKPSRLILVSNQLCQGGVHWMISKVDIFGLIRIKDLRELFMGKIQVMVITQENGE